MAAITQIKLSSTGTTYTINDARIGTSAISSCSYVLGMTSTSGNINPISTSNLASVLGVVGLTVTVNQITDAHARIGTTGIFLDCFTSGTQASNAPTQYGACITISKSGNGNPALLFWVNNNRLYVTCSWTSVTSAWKQLI